MPNNLIKFWQIWKAGNWKAYVCQFNLIFDIKPINDTSPNTDMIEGLINQDILRRKPTTKQNIWHWIKNQIILP